MKIDISQQRIDDDVFMKMRRESLALWPTGKEIDFKEAVAYQQQLPDSKNFCKVTQKLGQDGRTVVFPRAGQPIVEEEIELNKTLVGIGLPLIPVTTDSYTRGMKLAEAQKALEESIQTGKRLLNGYPIINHGVKKPPAGSPKPAMPPITSASAGWKPKNSEPKSLLPPVSRPCRPVFSNYSPTTTKEPAWPTPSRRASMFSA